MILLFHWIHWIIAYCKTTKRIGTLNFTNMNLPFVVINILIFCLSIAGHTTQGHTGCHKRVFLLLGLILVTCGPGYFNDFVKHNRSCANIGVPCRVHLSQYHCLGKYIYISILLYIYRDNMF